jgi:hypothetical protein
LIFAWLAACNRYDLFLVEDGTGGRGGDADVLFVIDGSDSMIEESVSLAENFGRFVEAVSSRAPEGDGLAEAVDQYAHYVQDPGQFVDFQLAIASVDAQAQAGALLGATPVLHKDDPALVDTFLHTLLCDAACFPDRQSVDSVAGYTCDQGFTGKVSQEYLDCLCGDSWLDNCGGGVEQGIEAVYDAACRALDDPPPECFQAGSLVEADAGTNAGLLRPKSTLIAVVVTDEGDGSPRVPLVEAVPTAYFDLFADLGVPVVWAAIDPTLTDDFEPRCPTGATSWGLMRYAYLVDATGGLQVDIHAPDCGPADWADALDQLGDLVAGGARKFPLPRAPVEDSIVVELDGAEVLPARALGQDVFGTPLYGDGWTYDAEENAVFLHGDLVPGPSDDVRIWFLPAAHR